MFPSIFVLPESSSIWLTIQAYIVLFFALALRFMRVRIFAAVLFGILLLGQRSDALMAVPGGCGTMCMAQMGLWGSPWYGPGIYAYPYMPYPYTYWQNPSYAMLPPWYGSCVNCMPYPMVPRAIQSLDK